MCDDDISPTPSRRPGGRACRARRAWRAVDDKLATLAQVKAEGADALSEEYIASVVRGAIDKLQHELVVFGRIDDDQPWRVGLYGIDAGGEQLVVDWRAPFAEAFYQAGFDDPRGLARRVSYVGHIDDLFVEDFASGLVSGSSPLMAELSRSRGEAMRAAVATLQTDQDRLVRLDPTARLVLRGGPGTGKTVVGLHRAAWLVYNDRRITADRILVVGPSDRFLRFVAAVLPTLGEARIAQTTFDRLLGPGSDAGRRRALARRCSTAWRPGSTSPTRCGSDRAGSRPTRSSALVEPAGRAQPAVARPPTHLRRDAGPHPRPAAGRGVRTRRSRCGPASPPTRPGGACGPRRGLEALDVPGRPHRRLAARSTATALWPTRCGPASRACRPATPT